MTNMEILDYFSTLNRIPVAPLIGYPFLKELNISATLALQDENQHLNIVKAVDARLGMDILLPLLDLTIEAEAMGAEVMYPEFDSPSVKTHVKIEDVGTIKYKMNRMKSMEKLMKMMKETFTEKPVGFYMTGPFTAAGQLIDTTNLIKLSLKAPESVEKIVSYTTDINLEYAARLEEAGADFIVLAEPSASSISPIMYRRLVKPYIERIGSHTRRELILHICGNSRHLLKDMVVDGIKGISIDENIPLNIALDSVSSNTLVLGNYSPTHIIMEKAETVKENVSAMVISTGGRRNYVISTGCDLTSVVPMENIIAFMNQAKSYRIN